MSPLGDPLLGDLVLGDAELTIESPTGANAVGREPVVVVELEQDQCRLIYGEHPCAAALGTTGTRKCYNTRHTCQDPTNYDSSTEAIDTDSVAQNVASPGWDLSLVGAVEASFSISGEEATSTGLFFSADGTRLYVIGPSSGAVHQYPLSTPWDVSTAGAEEASFSVTGEDTNAQDLFWKPDGSKFYIVGDTFDKVHQYAVTTSWDLATAKAVEASFDVSSEEGNPAGLAFSADGTKLYIVGILSQFVRQYPLSTAWEISTAGSVEASFSLSSYEQQGIAFNFDGTRMFTTGAVGGDVYQFPLSTAWDISSAGAPTNSFSVATEEVAPQGVVFSSDGTKLYVVGGGSDAVQQYPLSLTSGSIDGASHVAAHAFGFGQRLSFEADNSVEVLDALDRYGFAGTAAFTVEFWLQPSSISVAHTRIVSKEYSDGSGDQGWRIRLRQSDETIVFERLLNGASDEVSAAVTLGSARHWAAVYDGTDIVLYEEGIEKGRTASSKSITENAAALYVGNDSVGGTSEPFHGMIDDLRIWSVDRIEAEIRERMILPISGREIDLVGYFPFDDNPPGVATRTLRFTRSHSNMRRDLYLMPLLTDVSTAPTTINPGGGSRDRGVLGDRATVDVGFQDAPHSDRVVDKYRAERIDGTAQNDESGYDPLDRGTFFSKWRARNPYFQNRRLRIYEGYIGEELVDMQRREYFIDKLSGPNADGRVSISAKDVLKLADDDRAQAPLPTSGELNASLDSTETTSFQATGALIEDYPDEPGLVRINDEVIEYQTRSQVTADDVEFSTLTRGARGTTADDHDAEDRVQVCLEFVSVLPWQLVETLLIEYGNVPSEFIPTADWDAEGDFWLQQFTMSAVITEPTPVKDLISEISQQAQFFIWWNEHAQEIQLKALRPPTEDPVSIDDDAHILEQTSVLSEDPDQRISQVWVFFDQKDPTASLDDDKNFARIRIRADLEAESASQYGEPRVKKIYSRWLESEAQVIQVSKRTLDRFRDNARMLRYKIDAKDRESLRIGAVADVTTRTVVDDRGLPVSTRWQVISAREDPAGEAVDLDLLNFEFTGRFAFYAEDDTPDLDSASEEEIKRGAWYAGVDGKMPDGTDGFQMQ